MIAAPIFYCASLSDMEEDFEVIGGYNDILNPFLMTAIGRIKNASLVQITMREAIDYLAGHGSVGVGCFINDPVNCIVNEDRRLRAKDLTLYLSIRLGSGVIYDPVELITDIKPVINIPMDFRNRLHIHS